MKRSPMDKLARLEEKQNIQRDKIIDQAVQRLMAIWEVTPEEARERFLVMVTPRQDQ